jgi:hypothetical protein
MKRIKLDQNQFIALYQTLTDRGQTIGFEIYRRPTGNPVPFIACFGKNDQLQAHTAFQKLSIAMKMRGPKMSPQLKEQILTGQASYEFRGRKITKDARRHEIN